MKRSLQMIDELIEFEKLRDCEHKQLMISLHKGTKALGESVMLEHLRNLKELIKEESRDFFDY